MNNHALLMDISQYDIISFDVFDTAILRKVTKPRDVLLVVERLIEANISGLKSDNFSAKRYYAEINLVENIWHKDRSTEISLGDIYQHLCILYPEYIPFQQELMDLEFEAESLCCFKNENIYRLYRQALSDNKTIIFVSDIYLSHEQMSGLLGQCGYDKYFKLYVSCDIGKNKATGELFSHILDDVKIAANKILHVGDAQYSDVVQAKASGIDAYFVPKASGLLDSQRYLDSTSEYCLGSSVLLGLIQNYKLTKGLDSAIEIGYEVFGPLCLAFSNWIFQHAENKNIGHLYFIAREGWFLKKAFDILFPNSNISSHYFLASRRSLQFPFVSKENLDEDGLNFLFSTKSVPIKNYLDALDLTASSSLLAECGFDGPDYKISPNEKESDKHKLRKLFSKLATQIFKNANEEKRLFLAYLQSVGMLDIEDIGLVDSGWFGTTQRRIELLVREGNGTGTLHGFYFAMHHGAINNFSEQSKAQGFLYHFDYRLEDINEFLELARIIEVLLNAPSESIKRFIKKDQGLIPVYQKDNPNPQLDSTILNIQKGAEAFLKDYAALPNILKTPAPHHLVKHMFMHFVRQPTYVEAKLIGSILYEENVIGLEKNPMFSRQYRTAIDVLLHPLKISKEFSNSNWRAAYYKNLDSPFVRFFLRNTASYFLRKKPSYIFLRRCLRAAKRRVRLYLKKSGIIQEKPAQYKKF